MGGLAKGTQSDAAPLSEASVCSYAGQNTVSPVHRSKLMYSYSSLPEFTGRVALTHKRPPPGLSLFHRLVRFDEKQNVGSCQMKGSVANLSKR